MPKSRSRSKSKKPRRSKKGKGILKKKVRLRASTPSRPKQRNAHVKAFEKYFPRYKRNAGIQSTPTEGIAVSKGTVQYQSGPMINRGRGIRVRHSEYLQDITSTVAFNATPATNVYNINAGLIDSFPWLGAMGGLFETYMFHSLSWTYETNAPSTETGWFGMATQIDAKDQGFTGVQDMMGYNGSKSGPVWKSITHNSIIAGKKPLYIRTGTQPDGTDIRLYDYGNFTFATQGGSAANRLWGKLIVNYDVEFFTPKVTLAGALNFWKSFSGNGYMNTPSDIGGFLLGNPVQTGGNGPNDFVEFVVIAGLSMIKFNYPGLYTWVYRVINIDPAANFSATVTTGMTTVGASDLEPVTADTKSVVTNSTTSVEVSYASANVTTHAAAVNGFLHDAVTVVTTVSVVAAGALLYFGLGEVPYFLAAGTMPATDCLVTFGHLVTLINPVASALSSTGPPIYLDERGADQFRTRYLRSCDKDLFEKRLRIVEPGWSPAFRRKVASMPEGSNDLLKKRMQDGSNRAYDLAFPGPKLSDAELKAVRALPLDSNPSEIYSDEDDFKVGRVETPEPDIHVHSQASMNSIRVTPARYVDVLTGDRSPKKPEKKK